MPEHEDFATRRSTIEAERRALFARETDLLTDELKADEQSHAGLVTQVREAKDALDALRGEVEAAQTAYHSASNARSSAEFQLEQHRAYGPKPVASSYPTAQEKADWEDSLRARVAALEATEATLGDAWQTVDTLQAKRQATHKAFESLADEERHQRESLDFRRQQIARRKPQVPSPHNPLADKGTFVMTSGPSHAGAQRLPALQSFADSF